MNGSLRLCWIWDGVWVRTTKLPFVPLFKIPSKVRSDMCITKEMQVSCEMVYNWLFEWVVKPPAPLSISIISRSGLGLVIVVAYEEPRKISRCEKSTFYNWCSTMMAFPITVSYPHVFVLQLKNLLVLLHLSILEVDLFYLVCWYFSDTKSSDLNPLHFFVLAWDIFESRGTPKDSLNHEWVFNSKL